MQTLYVRFLALIILAAAQIFLNSPASAASLQYYKLAAPLKVGGAGGWDYVTLDPAGRLLYVTRSTHTMIVDVSTGKPPRTGLLRRRSSDDCDRTRREPQERQSGRHSRPGRLAGVCRRRWPRQSVCEYRRPERGGRGRHARHESHRALACWRRQAAYRP